MTPSNERDKAFEVLRELPVEVSMEQVGSMVAVFTLAPPAGSWFSHINLNSMLMTSAGAIIIAGSIYLLGPNDQQPRTAHAKVPAPPPAVEVAATPPAAVTEDPAPIVPIPVIAPMPGIKDEEVETPEVAETVVIPDVVATPATPAPVVAVVPAPPDDVMALEAPMADFEGIVMVSSGREFELSGFTGVNVLGAMDVAIDQGPFSVTAEGDPTMVDRLELSVKDKILLITTRKQEGKDECTSAKSVTVRVKMPELQRIDLTGSGDVLIGDFTGTGDLDLGLQGSGDVHFSAFKGLTSLTIGLSGSGDIMGEGAEVSGKAKISVAGSGDVSIAGRADVLEVSVVGSGDVDAGGLKSRECEVQVTGSGDVNVNCNGSMHAHTTGSGAVNNTGSAGGGGSNGKGSDSN